MSEYSKKKNLCFKWFYTYFGFEDKIQEDHQSFILKYQRDLKTTRCRREL